MPLDRTLPVLVFTIEGSDLCRTSIKSKEVAPLPRSREEVLLNPLAVRVQCRWECLYIIVGGIDARGLLFTAWDNIYDMRVDPSSVRGTEAGRLSEPLSSWERTKDVLGKVMLQDVFWVIKFVSNHYGGCIVYRKFGHAIVKVSNKLANGNEVGAHLSVTMAGGKYK